MATRMSSGAPAIDARFVNNAMMATLMGAVISDGLENGQVVSGVGGQYNFVAQAFALQGARSILTVEATRQAGAGTQSNIRWSYGHETIPRHLRDIIVTEYGVADLRGKSDADVIAAMLAGRGFALSGRTDAAGQGRRQAAERLRNSGRASREFSGADRGALKPARDAGLLPSFPFGSDFTDVEQRLIPALQFLQDAQRTPLRLPGLLWQGLTASAGCGRRGMPGAARPRPAGDMVRTRLPRAGQRGAGAKRVAQASEDRVSDVSSYGEGPDVRRCTYLFLFTGLRFSMNAAMPSVRSSSAKVE